jgi:hypothetical protein
MCPFPIVVGWEGRCYFVRPCIVPVRCSQYLWMGPKCRT